MARMIPVDGPIEAADVSSGERSVFALLNQQLSDEFLVIHSLPWLTKAVREVDVTFAPTGEIDFLVLHPELGLLALEVKSGRYTVHGSLFTNVKSGTTHDILRQTRHNAHGLARWLGSAGFRQKIGYGFVFPHNSFSAHTLPPGFEDPAMGERLTIEYDDLPRAGERVTELMRYWKQTLSAPGPGKRRIEQLVQMLCPAFDGAPTWAARVASNTRFFLRLTAEQAQVVERVCRGGRTVVTGWPGTGKTLIAIEITRRLVALGKTVLFVTFNMRLAQWLRDQFSEQGSACQVTHWHKLCASARQALGRSSEDDAWLTHGCLVDLTDALKASLVNRFDVVIIDEAQALRPEWIDTLVHHVSLRFAAVFCDETQRFSFEAQGATLDEVLKVVGVNRPFVLTQVARMPRAVTDRLIGVSDPDYQVTSRREVEADTLRELVFDVSPETLEKCMFDLLAKGFVSSEIAVLTSPLTQTTVAKAISHLAVDVESVARFRGLEAPAVIIVNAHELTDAELFCAYSRATTLCVALYDVESLAWHPRSDRFHQPLVTMPANRAAIDKAREASLASDIVCRHSEAALLALDTVVLGWSKRWGGWVIEVDNDLHILWIDFLCEYLGATVYYWRKNARRDFAMRHQNAHVGQSEWAGTLVAEYCKQCDAVIPHLIHKGTCQSCAGVMGRDAPPPKRDVLLTLSAADATINMARSAPDGWRVNTDLPLQLYALAVAELARASHRYEALGFRSTTSGTLLYQVAAHCLQAKLVRSEPGAPINSKAFADSIASRVPAVACVDIAKWRAAMANAFATLYQKKVLERVDRGVYRLPE